MDTLESIGSGLAGIAVTLLAIAVLIVPVLIARTQPIVIAIPVLIAGSVIAGLYIWCIPHIMNWVRNDKG